MSEQLIADLLNRYSSIVDIIKQTHVNVFIVVSYTSSPFSVSLAPPHPSIPTRVIFVEWSILPVLFVRSRSKVSDSIVVLVTIYVIYLVKGEHPVDIQPSKMMRHTQNTIYAYLTVTFGV